MDRSTILNVSNRVKWLQDYSNGEKGEKKLTSEDLKDAKAFCLLEIEGLFKRIAYNTLKQCLKSEQIDTSAPHSSGDNWSHFIALRKRCHELLKAQEGAPITGETSDLTKVLKDSYKNALWHSNLCANAYLELRRDIQGVMTARSANTELDYRRIERILKKSASTYNKIISQTPDTPAPILKLVTDNS